MDREFDEKGLRILFERLANSLPLLQVFWPTRSTYCLVAIDHTRRKHFENR
jgi:hypothetical protein